MADFPRRKRPNEQRAKAVTANGPAGHQAATIGEPFHQRGNRANVTHAHAEPRDDAVTYVQPFERMARSGKSGDHVSDAVEDSGHRGHFPRTHAVLPKSADHRAESEKYNRQRKIQGNIGKPPVFHADERLDEHAPPVHRSQADLHDHSRYRDTPSISKMI